MIHDKTVFTFWTDARFNFLNPLTMKKCIDKIEGNGGYHHVMIHVKIHVVENVVGLPRAFRIISSHLCPFGVFRDSGMTSPPPPQSVTVKLKR